ncbi:hypothetical protein HLH34_06120 [Gluconacetobacter azotocaptans]|uniref:Lipid A biosynthesis lauroyl acyltransferase n=1 Tax=Gluconacetobacter azotocaptans TaxID=142834 RepID=A0A7W4PDA7_9PROT|nr:hypothetical protein [Gluconacetobacter azotocaptans]MBB2189538.1 hypothetical protein [Gluconacetobacter azotocaptans]GBQ36642.1 lipid A biosynthesis lauroyl acyltransferase [Gluconacetobacter azotocaptans DSM 13594]
MVDQAPPLSALWSGTEARAAWRRYWVRDTVSGLSDTAIHYGLRALPVGLCARIGWRLGIWRGTRHPTWHTRALRNVRRLRPELDDAAVDRTVRQMWGHVGSTMAEFSALPRIWDSDRVAVDGLENLEAARATGRPRIVAALHLGNWEMVGPTMLALGENGFDVYQPPRNRFEQRIANYVRRRFADHLLAPGRATARLLYKALAEDGRSVVLYVDEFQNRRVHAPFFGRPLRLDGNLARVARLARMADAVIIPAYCLREEHGRFRVHILPPVRVGSEKDRSGLAQDVARLDAIITPIIRRHIEQWFMLHDLVLDDV